VDAPLLTPFSVSSEGWECLAATSPSGRVAFLQRDGDVMATQVLGSDEVSRSVDRHPMPITRDTATESRPSIVDRVGQAPA
jgi:hypothetical protein